MMGKQVIMRMSHQLGALLLLVVSPYAFARGGPGGMIAAMMEWLLVLAVLSGIVIGAVVGCMTRRISWKAIVLLLIAFLAIGMAIPIIGVFICIPLGVLVVLFATAYDVVTNGHLTSPSVDDASPDTNGQRFWAGPVAIRNVIRWMAGSYLFWAVVSLANIELLAFLLVPPAIPFFPGSLTKILPFAFPPLLVALGIGVIAIMVYRYLRKEALTNRYLLIFAFNACVLISFLTMAELYREHLMSQALQGHEPTQWRYSTFLNSVISYNPYFRSPHARFVEDGKTYHWSYLERKFIPAP